MINMWYTVNNETGDKIDSFMTLEDAVRAVRTYETGDKKDVSYTDGFYEIYNDITKLTIYYRKGDYFND